MENASKALLIAGGIMLTMLIVALVVYAWSTYTAYQTEKLRLEEAQNVARFNRQFTNYERKGVLGNDLMSLINKVIDYNQRQSGQGLQTTSPVGNSNQFKEIELTIEMDMSTEEAKKNIYYGSITIPAVVGGAGENTIGIGTDHLFKDTGEIFTVGIDGNKIKSTRMEDIKEKIDDIEFNEKSYHGGRAGIQNLVKNINSIYTSNIVRINGQMTDGDDYKGWYEASYIIGRFKTLTGINPEGSNEKEKIEWIRSEDQVKNILRYYEFTQFKKAIFDCTGIEYDEGTGRVISMSFKFTGKVK